MRRINDVLLTVTLLALVLSGPAAVAAYLLAGDAVAPAVILAASGDERTPAAGEPSARAREGAAPPVIAGMLYTRGAARVDWNGVALSVNDSRYAYLGGEEIGTGDTDMGVLELDGGSRVYVCPGSRLSVARDADGAYRVRLTEGGGRFAFAAGSDYRIEANRGVLSPADGGAAPSVVEVSVFRNHPGGVVCGFGGRTNVAAYPAAGGPPAAPPVAPPVAIGTAGAGEIIDLSRALRDESAAGGTPVVMEPIAMPESVRSWLRANAPYPPEPGPVGYLCRCEELKRYAEADGIPDAAIVPRMSPPASAPLAATLADGGAPPVPPATPTAALALPGAPDAADAAVLPSPPAVLSVPPPLVPIRGHGGGFVSTPS